MKIELEDVARIKLQPGEVLYIRLQGPTPPLDMVNRIKQHLGQYFPNNLILVSGTDAEIKVIQPA